MAPNKAMREFEPILGVLSDEPIEFPVVACIRKSQTTIGTQVSSHKGNRLPVGLLLPELLFSGLQKPLQLFSGPLPRAQ